jgi:outer membrane protein OmpA-like peptidoglycan-associated protein
VEGISKAVRTLIGGLALACGLLGGAATFAQDREGVVGQIEWGVWIDDDGCMHWWADGGLEGYMVPRRNPHNGKPVCLRKNTCLVENTDTLFATDSAKLTHRGRAQLQNFFQNAGAFGYAIYGHTDSRASDEYNMDLSHRRAKAVADVARSVGASVERQLGFGERQPIASNASAEGMARNRRVEIVCYRW